MKLILKLLIILKKIKPMTYKIISTENYLLIVDDSQITEGDWHIKINKNKVGNYPLDSVNPNKGRYKKIIAHLPLNGASILNGVDLLPPLEDEAEVMAEEYSKNYYYDNAQDDVYHGFFQGYNKAKEKYKYTEEDLRKAIRMGIQKHPYAFDGKEPKYKYSEDEIIQSLQQPKYPIGFECEVINCDKCVYVQGGNLSPDCCNKLKPKTTINSQGLTQWVGRYILS